MEEQELFNVEKIKTAMKAQYPMGYVPRCKIEDATGGILHSRTMANYDSDKEREGIKGAIRIGGKVCYPINEIISFVESKTKLFDDES